MTSRFDLEQAIMLAWQTSDDIDLLYKHHGDAPRPMTEDERKSSVQRRGYASF